MEYNEFLNRIRDINGEKKPGNHLKIALCIDQVRELVNKMAPHSRGAGLSVERIRLIAKIGITSLGQLVYSVEQASRDAFFATFSPHLRQAPSDHTLCHPTTQRPLIPQTFPEKLQKIWNQQLTNGSITSTTTLAMLKRDGDAAFSPKGLAFFSLKFAMSPYGAYIYALLATGKGAEEISALFSKIPAGTEARGKMLQECVDALLLLETMNHALTICNKLPLIDHTDIEGIKEEISMRVLNDITCAITTADEITDTTKKTIACKTIARVLWQQRKIAKAQEAADQVPEGRRQANQLRDQAIETAAKIPLNDLRSAVLRYMSTCLSREGDTAKAAEVAAKIQKSITPGTPHPEASKIEELLPSDVAKAVSQDNTQEGAFQILQTWFENQEPFQNAFFPLMPKEVVSLTKVFTNCVLRMGSRKAVEQAKLLENQQKQSIAFRSIAACLCARDKFTQAIDLAQQIPYHQVRLDTFEDIINSLKSAGKEDVAQNALEMIPVDDRREVADNATPPWELDLRNGNKCIPMDTTYAQKRLIREYADSDSTEGLLVHITQQQGLQSAFNILKWIEIDNKRTNEHNSDPTEYFELPCDEEIMDSFKEIMPVATEASIQAGQLEEAIDLYKQTGKPNIMAFSLCKALLARGRVEEAKKMMKRNDQYFLRPMKFLRLLFDQVDSSPDNEELEYFVGTGNFCRAVNNDHKFWAKKLAKAITQAAPSSLSALPSPTEKTQ